MNSGSLPKEWLIPDVPDRLPQYAGLPCGQLLPIVAGIIAARGYDTAEAAASFLSPSLSAMIDPFMLRGMDLAVGRLVRAHSNNESICVYGDYDVDGITGTALLVSFLKCIGCRCIYFIPNRFDDGYGLNFDAIERIIADGADLIVSVDCGITAIKEADLCRERGVDLIIVDHHSPLGDIPDACAVLNPLQPGCSYPFKSLAGVGVAFNLLVALRAKLRDLGHFGSGSIPDLREWLDLVAMGTIADVVPLTGQNRIYVFNGLKRLSESSRTGILALKRVAGITGAVSCGQVGFRLAPRLNAAGRMESAVPGVDLLLGSDAAEAWIIATELDAANAERQQVERRIFDEAVKMVDTTGMYPECRSIVLASFGWHQGVIGIVASRMVERYHRPTILIALDGEGMGKGSGRSIPGFHLLDALVGSSDHLERFGGHRYAAGVSLKADNVDSFAKAFEKTAAVLLDERDLVPRLAIDVELKAADITRELSQELKLLEPYGAGNPEPVLMLRDVTVLERRPVGDGHIRLRIKKDGIPFTGIAFRMAGRSIPDCIDVAFYPEMNEWNGSSSLQLRIKDLRPAE
jgi:single-stranded-DNA-specific exonuclease